MKISIIIPAYNEEDSIKEVVQRTKKTLPDAEIIVVDDGSTDSTYANAKKTGVRVIRYTPNKGKIYALKTGFENAKHDTIGMIDSDGSYPPEDFPKLISKIKDYDIVVGSRFARGFAKGLPWFRNMANIVGSFVISIINMTRITDATSGMRVFKKELTKLPIQKKIEPQGGLEYEVMFTTMAIRKGYKYKDVAIDFEERKGRSKLKFFRDIVKFLLAALKARFM